MRGMRWLLPVAIIAILGGIGFKYRAQKEVLRARDNALVKPAPLPVELDSTSELWHLREKDTATGRVTFDISAKDFRQLKDKPRADLKEVTLKVPSKTGDTYNLIKSASASFFTDEHRLYSEGDVEVTLNVPGEGLPKHELVVIKSSAVNYDTAGRAETDRPSAFTFEHGDGTATGAVYDPATHLLLMKNDVKLDWKPAGPNAKTMKIEGGSLEYHEADSQIWLKPWGRLTRDNTIVEGENPIIHLQANSEGHKVIHQVDATHAHGSDDYPTRKLQYSADILFVYFNDDGVVQDIAAHNNARLVSTSDTAETTVTADHVDLHFEAPEKESILSAVTATGNSVVTSKPLPGPGRQLAETHVLRSDKLDMKMRPGGREIESVITRTPGSLEFLPNLPTQHHRTMEGSEMTIAYGAQNRIESFRSTNVRTKTDPTADEAKRNRKASITTSKELVAHFDAKGNMSSMEQAGDFKYEEGDRRASSAKASLDSGQNVILLDTGARMADSSGSTSADRIRLDERSGDFIAEGNVNSSRLPDKDQKKNSQMLSGDDPLQAQARKMESTNRNRTIHYEGGVHMWQGANQLDALVVDLDREKKGLVADGNVVTNLWEQPNDDPKNAKKKAAGPVLTVVHSPHLVYTEENRLATYSGGALLTRPNLQVKGREIRAFLSNDTSDSKLEKAYADGAVQIHMTSSDGSRTGTAEHSEYYTTEPKVILKGGDPTLIEREPNGKDRKTTKGVNLTYFPNDGRLLVDGSAAQPGQSQIQRKAHK